VHYFSVGKVVLAEVSGEGYSKTQMMKKNISTLLPTGLTGAVQQQPIQRYTKTARKCRKAGYSRTQNRRPPKFL